MVFTSLAAEDQVRGKGDSPSFGNQRSPCTVHQRTAHKSSEDSPHGRRNVVLRKKTSIGIFASNRPRLRGTRACHKMKQCFHVEAGRCLTRTSTADCQHQKEKISNYLTFVSSVPSVKKTQTEVVRARHTIIWTGQDCPTGNSSRRRRRGRQ